jgi:predicted nuclease of predicted toxin-antitoxin system
VWLVDNNVPRAVTLLLRDPGADVEEVRAILGQTATDDEIAAFARATGRRVITPDVRFARAALRSGLPHLWLRLPESQARDAIHESYVGIEKCLGAGARRVVVRADRIDRVGESDGNG